MAWSEERKALRSPMLKQPRLRRQAGVQLKLPQETIAPMQEGGARWVGEMGTRMEEEGNASLKRLVGRPLKGSESSS